MTHISKLSQPWIPSERIESLAQLEPALMVIGLFLTSLLIYKIFLRRVSQERHRNLRRLFKNASLHLVFSAAAFAGYYFIEHANASEAFDRFGAYVGLVSVLWWTLSFVKISRILLFEYLFIMHMRVGVPVLLVNLFTLLLSALMGGWLATELFSVQIGPLLATSAIFSIVLGLALQDTLGNLFSGVAMQFDKPYEIGDWIEILLNGQKFVGQVQEISWRATVLLGLCDESISVPNRLMGQTQISNFSAKSRPIIRSQMFRLPYGTPIEKAKKAMLEAARSVSSVREAPSPIVLIAETNDSWMGFKLIYFIDDFGSQLTIGDRVIAAATQGLARAGIELAAPRILVLNQSAGDISSEIKDCILQNIARPDPVIPEPPERP